MEKLALTGDNRNRCFTIPLPAAEGEKP